MEYTYQQVNEIPSSLGINPNLIKRLPDNVIIPNDPENTDWQAYQLWIEQGNQPLPPA